MADIDIEREVKEAAERVTERKVIRAGRDAWLAIDKSESFAGWCAIGRALMVGRQRALRETGANSPSGQIYSKAFSQWIREHGFERMRKSARSDALELAQHEASITAWRATLSERNRRRLVHPLSNVRRWRASLAHGFGKTPDPSEARSDCRVEVIYLLP